ncbi:MAG TPA: hypothetical protein VMS37_35920 [Verrucomicrobiae bacterium]|nr:hypothetical protein [Verrucomicrobiae bacterium]
MDNFTFLRRFVLAFSLMIITAVALQQAQPIPPFEGDGNSAHDGQPAWCQNADSGGYTHNCDCQPKMGDPECDTQGGGGESSKCSVYCRKNACRCKRHCNGTR